mmetsp:Transcript_25649/g.39428  ORF Transcript_25649/g.39428 Transcript_25649/m.39428 type:complete len:179 (+) Transcript_25649:202-738(+)|eukprot:CAMPEP_0195286118 /NCGR_PEP_ID=MMETSP0707-20130614/3693_1 /TAXON_ID=33640 /ORGANISM="Asterionellopsis glacialis, Strain CCMP134" /LENGTH=178 /DNA_ID=CAMNT_0040345711 /DNA_START=194 /DNA_END=730 /DNA_ORIENTATION=+
MPLLPTLLRDTIFAGGLGLGADLVCQLGFEQKRPDEINCRRAASVAMFSGAYMGIVCSYVYSLYPPLAALVMRSSRMCPTKTMKVQGVVSSVADNALHVPALYIPAYFMTVGPLQGVSLMDSCSTLKEKWWDTTSTCWMFWMPFMAVNFTVVPASHRVRAVAAANFVWTIALDYITHE